MTRTLPWFLVVFGGLTACSGAGKSSNTVVGAGGANCGPRGSPDLGAAGREGGLGSHIDYSIWALQLPIGSGTSDHHNHIETAARWILE